MKLKKTLAIGLSAAIIASLMTPGNIYADDMIKESVPEFVDGVNTESSEEQVADSDTCDDVADLFSDGEENAVQANDDSGNIIERGQVNDTVTWTLYNNGELIIDGTGDMANYDSDRLPPWNTYRKDIESITFEKNITSVGNYTCYSLYKLNSVNIKGECSRVGEGAFEDCTGLKSIKLPEKISVIGNRAFAGCKRMNDISIPQSVTRIGYFAFYDCSSLKSVTIPDGVKCISNDLFSNCVSLTSVDIPESITEIGYSAFSGCKRIKNINIPKSVSVINTEAFKGCSGLTSIKIPEGVSYISQAVFSDCSSLTDIDIPDSVTVIGYSAFSNCSSLSNIIIPKGVTSLGAYAFAGCTKLNDIVLPDEITVIDNGTFNGCKSLTNMIIPREVISIHNGAFMECINLTSIIIPDSVISIDSYAFANCNSLIDFYIPEGVVTLGEGAFYGCKSLKSIYIPESIASVEDVVFAGCDNLRAIRYPDSREAWDSLNVSYVDNAIVYCNYDPSHTHSYIFKLVKPGNCTEKGMGEEICEICGDYYEIEIPATDHTWNKGIITQEATCTETGMITYTCNVCGGVKKEEIPKTDHNAVTDKAVLPTCETDGLTEGSHCSVCGKILVPQNVVPAGHSWDEGKVTKEPTCEEDGIKICTCTVCGKTEEKRIKASGHNEVKDAAVTVTCETNGLTEGSHCSVCGKVLTEQTTILAAGHKFTAWKTDKEANVFSPKKQSRVCSVCNKREQREVGKKLQATMKVSVASIPLRVRQKTTVLKVYGLAAGDSVSSWKSCNTKIAKISGKSNGTSIITAGTKTGKVKIIIKLKSGLKKTVVVSVQKSTVRTEKITGVSKKLELKRKQKVVLNPVLTPLTSEEKVIYKSDNSKVVSVNAKGKITALKKGSAVITVKSGSKTVKCKVTVR